MSSRDPYRDLPNLTHRRSSASEGDRTGDPSRYFPSIIGGTLDPVTARILFTPVASVSYNGVGTIPDSTPSVITFDTADIDNDHMWNGASALGVKSEGIYIASAQVAYSPTAAGSIRWSWIRVNGTAVHYGDDQRGPAATNIVWNNISSFPLHLLAGDFVELETYQDTGVPLALTDAVGASARLSLWHHSTLGGDNQ